jgi:TRAP-type C4-dicarboxylate transport system permease small subunit
MVRLLTTATKVAGLTCSLLMSAVTIGLLIQGIIRYTQQRKSR